MIQGLRGREIKQWWRLTTTNSCSGKKFIPSMIKFLMKIQMCGCILKFISSHQPLLFNLPKVQTACLWLTIQRHIWIVRSYIMLHIKGGTKTSILIIKRFFDILSWQGWCLWKPKWFMLDRTGSSVGSSALCSRRMQIHGQGQRRPKGVLRCKGRSGRKELDVKKRLEQKTS